MSAQAWIDHHTDCQPNDRRATIGQAEAREPRWMLALLTFLALALTVRAGTRAVGDPDIWWHLKTKQYVLNGGSLSFSRQSLSSNRECSNGRSARRAALQYRQNSVGYWPVAGCLGVVGGALTLKKLEPLLVVSQTAALLKLRIL